MTGAAVFLAVAIGTSLSWMAVELTDHRWTGLERVMLAAAIVLLSAALGALASIGAVAL